MKKIAIITIHVGFNFGSILQTIATSESIKKLGCEPTVINYIPDRVTYSRYFKDGLSNVKKFIKRTLSLPIYIINHHVYSSYLAKYVKLSNAIYSKDIFAAVCPKADILMTGSDQVWNSIHNEGFDGHYFFQGIENTPKIAFCSSIGRESIDSFEANKMKFLLKEYKAISVREMSAVNILNDLGISAEQLIDPTFLLNKKEWEKYTSLRKYKMPYILIYTPYNTVDKDLIYKSAKKLAKQFGLKIVTFSWIGLPERQADKTFLFANPGDFLSLMLHADYIITNSFHGTAFSINLNKQFWVFEPSAFLTRIKSILGLTGLDSRLLNNGIKDSDMASAIDYSQVNKILELERIKSFDFLKNALS